MDKNELRQKLEEKLKEKANHVTDKDKHYVDMSYLNQSLDVNPHMIMSLAMEEMAELTIVLNKLMRGKLQGTDLELIEEIADVEIELTILKEFLRIPPEVYEYVKDIKYERTLERIIHDEWADKTQNKEYDLCIEKFKKYLLGEED